MFRDRQHAGHLLAEACTAFSNTHPIVLALPRGGVPVAYEIALALHAPLDILVVRKIGSPWNPEFGLGAIAEDVEVFDEDSMRFAGVDRHDLLPVIQREKAELSRRNKLYRGNRSFPDLRGHTVILVDDGIATGVTIKAAIQALRAHHPGKIILAVPVAPPDTIKELDSLADDVICLESPSNFMAVGASYESFPQTTDDEVISILGQQTS